ncbi:sulfate transporter family-domain-containing protein [Spinellus fusiger]|nr:sulfate transporter family-domain-containing protein [Spinellus fusiger]
MSYLHLIQTTLNKLPRHLHNYLLGLFPIAIWLPHYHSRWFVRDLIAGVTVGIVVVPQSMAYAKLATLSPEYGLYTAFIGLCIYCLFATSKDISIGPTAVMSLLLGQTIARVSEEIPTITGPEVAVTMSLLTGIIATALGLFRLGSIVDLVPGPAISGFITASALTITVGQLPKLLGLSDIHSQEPVYLILIKIFRDIQKIQLDAVFGGLGLVWLYGVRFFCQKLSNRYPHYSDHFFFIGIMRNGLLVIFGALAAWILTNGSSESPINILGNIPSGFHAIGVPRINATLVSAVIGTVPSAVIILVLEHIAIGKAFGKVNHYTIDPSQEMVAIGFSNIWGSFLGGYPSTGSFSRTAIKARSGVQTPLAGLFSAALVVLALYVLTPAFYYIPDAVLAAMIIHAVIDLVSSLQSIRQLASVSISELVVFLSSVIVTVFTTVEYGIYVSVAVSTALLLVRMARPRLSAGIEAHPDTFVPIRKGRAIPTPTPTDEISTLDALLKEHPAVDIPSNVLPPGVLVCRIEESLTYLNTGYVIERLIGYCQQATRRDVSKINKKLRAWNEVNSVKDDTTLNSLQPYLRALIFDLSSVNFIDSNGLQALVDAQASLSRYSAYSVEFHFIHILHPSIHNALFAAGFGNQPCLLEIKKRMLEDKEEQLSLIPLSRTQSRAQSLVSDLKSDYGTLNEANTSALPVGHYKIIMKDLLACEDYPFFHKSMSDAIQVILVSMIVMDNVKGKAVMADQDIFSAV